MGHQVNYYLLPEELRALESRVRMTGSVVLLHRRSKTNQPQLVDSIGVIQDGKPWLFYVWARSEDLMKVVLREVPEQGFWVVDEQRSPVVEFDCCGFNGETLNSGRLYYVDGFWGPDRTWIEKPEPFRKWAKSVLAVAKKTLIRRDREYLGPAANKWLSESEGRLGL